MTPKTIFLAILLLAVLAVPALALPTTQAATGIGCRTATFHGTSAVGGLGWFDFGIYNGGPYQWKTPNFTIPIGAYAYTQPGVPLVSCMTFYFVACDTSGCDIPANQQFFTTAPITPMVQSTYGVPFQNISNSNFNISVVAAESIKPFTWVFPPAVFYGTFLFFVFTGMWLRNRDMTIPTIVGFLASGIILYGSALTPGIPPEMSNVAVGVAYASLAGIFFTIFHR
jgi:hypothetical protein